MTPSPRPLVGAHVPVAGGLARGALPYAAEIGAEVVQVFVTNPRGWATRAGDPDQDRAFRDAVEAGLPAFVHASFLVNLAGPDASITEKSVASVEHTLGRAAAIGASGVVVHTGSAVTAGRLGAALAQVRERLLPVLDAQQEGAPLVLLEPTAGQGRSVCSTLDELAVYLGILDRHPRLGLCLDTCHAFAAGHDLAGAEAMGFFLDDLGQVLDGVPLSLVHANDSMDVAGAHRDRHASIGAGHLGAEAFGALMRHPVASGTPLVIETPGGKEEHVHDIALLKALRNG